MHDGQRRFRPLARHMEWPEGSLATPASRSARSDWANQQLMEDGGITIDTWGRLVNGILLLIGKIGV